MFKLRLQLKENLPLLCYIGLSIAILLTIYLTAIKYEMHVTTRESMNLYFAKYIAAAISSIEHNLHGFIGYNNIFNILNKDTTISDSLIKQALSVKDVTSGGTFKLVAMDLGFCTYTKISFLFFGYKVKSFLLLYFSVLIISIISYFIEFKNNRPALTLLITYLLALYLVAFKSVNMPLNVAVIYGFRFISLLAVLPLMHLALFNFLEPKSIYKSTQSIIPLLIQSTIIAWIQYLRMSTKWMNIFMLVLIFINSAILLKKDRNSLLPKLIIKSLPSLLYFFIIFSSKLIFTYNSNDVYKKPGEGAHVFWHSIYTGLALHPEIRKAYTNERLPDANQDTWGSRSTYKPSDQDAYTAALRWLIEHKRSEYELFNFKQSDKVDFKSVFTFYQSNPELQDPSQTIYARKIDMEKDFNWGADELVVKEVVFDVLKNYPLQVLQVTLIIKPLKFLNIYLTDFIKISRFLHPRSLFSSSDFFAFTIKHVALLAILVSLSFLLMKSTANLFQIIIPIFFIFVISLIIPIAVYPEPWGMGDQAAILTTLIYLLIIATIIHSKSYLLKNSSRVKLS